MTAPEPTKAAEVAAAIASGNALVCYTRCWPCHFGECCDPPKWHSWADSDDVKHAEKTGQPDPRTERCGCSCADAEKVIP